ncbi:MAG: beta-lactamase family protein [Planctomycetales bacterium]|nr:beta-lactamase family protein [Planctomycetales bacterium]
MRFRCILFNSTYALLWIAMMLSQVAFAEDELPIATGPTAARFASFDQLMQTFLREHKIPGGALAVAQNGEVIYARGFGWADREAQQAVQPDSLFRIASISKPVTAVAVMRLVEQRRLSLDDHVFDILDRAQANERQTAVSSVEPAFADERLGQITIRQLLQHTAGWDRDVSFDPMFRSVKIARELQVDPPAKPEHVIRYMRRQPLDFAPGERYAYSNFGYCLLGRVIERVTGRDYEEYVRAEVLRPLGINAMRIGKTQLGGRAGGEVRYYTGRNGTGDKDTGGDAMGDSVFAVGERVPLPYGAWHLEAMDSHGGWIASAVDLVRFGSSIQHPAERPLLSAASREAMFARPAGAAGWNEDGSPKDVYYGCGWSVRDVGSERFNYWHTGSLDGTSTILVLRHDGLCWAVLFNTRDSSSGEAPARIIDPLVHKAANQMLEATDQ